MRPGYALVFVSVVGLFLNGGCGSTSQAHKPPADQLPIVTQDAPPPPPAPSKPPAPAGVKPGGNGVPNSVKNLN